MPPLLRLLIDECLDSPYIVEPLKEQRHRFRVKTVGDFDLRGRRDSEILRFAQQNRYIVVTADQKYFGQTENFPEDPQAGVICVSTDGIFSAREMLTRFLSSSDRGMCTKALVILREANFDCILPDGERTTHQYRR